MMINSDQIKFFILIFSLYFAHILLFYYIHILLCFILNIEVKEYNKYKYINYSISIYRADTHTHHIFKIRDNDKGDVVMFS